MRFGAILAARSDSTRLPGKALLPLLGLPIVVLIVRRIRTSRLLSDFVFATTDRQVDDELAAVVAAEGVKVFRGAAEDVLHRFVEAAKMMDCDRCVRISGDCPFIGGPTLDLVLERCSEEVESDLVTTKPAFPNGIDYEIYPKAVLEKIDALELTAEEREHILNYIVNNPEQHLITRLVPPPELMCDRTIFLLDTDEDFKGMTSLTRGIDDIHVDPVDLIRRHLSAS